ncbi:dGTP triphosphohydrolase [Myxococcus sp. AM010]|uniref:dGTP triphosphohydrolase n=1 Tax=Myxococcus sp. AM010 TaxID=2745138 RepID=UPI0015957F84|nr:dNTP triphosphohydrolase [Myxococcus sp. AM010]NVJ13395.1 dNTP triphosphohydrolase [Myxococcus sp. AM010]
MSLDWTTLLCIKRLREIEGGSPSQPTTGDDRSAFDRDYDRAIFSTPVRRLQDKTQVFPLDPNDAVRTRLTHSMEVSTLARGLARGAARWMLNEKHLKDADQALEFESIAATCGLIHDLGNPPFGHAGERAISSWFDKRLKHNKDFFTGLGDESTELGQQLRNDFLYFEGNAQTLRIVSRLQLLADTHGLNLTVGTLSAAMKYTAASHELVEKQPHERTKPGYFASENVIVQTVRKHAGTDAMRNPIAYLVESCDDMVYATVDIEDGVKKGIISWSGLKKALLDAADSDEKAIEAIQVQIAKTENYINKARKRPTGKSLDEAHAQYFRTLIIGETKVAVLKAFQHYYSDLMERRPIDGGELIPLSAASALIKACKKVGRTHIYTSEETLRLETMGRNILHDLMDIFWEGASAYPLPTAPEKHEEELKEFRKSPEGKIYRLLSENYRTAFESAITEKRLPPLYHRFQLVTDYVCGMTDTFACKLHSQLTHG